MARPLSVTVAQVCCGWQCDMYEVLASVRAVRPGNGGSGCDAAVLAQLQGLNFMLS